MLQLSSQGGGLSFDFWTTVFSNPTSSRCKVLFDAIRQFEKKYRLLRADIITIQSVVRMRQAKIRFNRSRKSAIAVQSLFRMRKGARIKMQLLVEYYAAVTIQSVTRGHLLKAQISTWHNAATKIQAAFRSYVSQVCFHLDLMDIICVQSISRGWICRSRLVKMHDSSIVLQKAVRQFLAFRRVNSLLLCKRVEKIRNDAALSIQTAFRQHWTTKKYQQCRLSAIAIQAAFRGHIASVKFMFDMMSIIVAQSYARQWLATRAAKRRVHSVIVLQKAYRSRLARAHVSLLRERKAKLERTIRAAVLIQSAWRSNRALFELRLHIAARRIQKTWRCFVSHVDYLIKLLSVIKIQSAFRQYRAKRLYTAMEKGFTSLQAVARGRVSRGIVATQLSGFLRLQAVHRGSLDRRNFARSKEAAVTLQKMTRGFLVRLDLEIANFGASEIQRIWRGYSAFVDYALTVFAAIKVQAFTRRLISRRRYQELLFDLQVEEMFMHSQAIKIQKCYTRYRSWKKQDTASRTIQRSIRVFLDRSRIRKFRLAVTKFQAAFRARSVRKRRTKRVATVARRVLKAESNAKANPTRRLGYMTSRALEVLLNEVLVKSGSLAEIMDAVKTLETSTSLSPKCCEAFAQVGTPKILLELVQSCNRSIPHQELLHYIFLTFYNVAQHKHLIPSFANVYSAEIFLDQLQMFRDKETIFFLSVHLLGAISACNPHVRVSF